MLSSFKTRPSCTNMETILMGGSVDLLRCFGQHTGLLFVWSVANHLMREAIKYVVHMMREVIEDVVHLMREAIKE